MRLNKVEIDNAEQRLRDDLFARRYLCKDELGCKGITVYRDGSRQHQTLSSPANDTGAPESLAGAPESLAVGKPRPRSRVTIGQTSKFRTGRLSCFEAWRRPGSSRRAAQRHPLPVHIHGPQRQRGSKCPLLPGRHSKGYRGSDVRI